MIAVDTSALVAMALGEPEADAFARIIARETALIGTPTLLETRMVLVNRIGDHALAFIDAIIHRPSIRPVAFSLQLSDLAAEAFDRFGKGRHPAGLNFGDCMAYAVAKAHDVPLLFKGDDFSCTDVRVLLV
ncbi:type II toxin-antitoxin system VapC family toxin [Xanthobacter oligotrophicus]|uniref:Ribonuclease VapC n=1 Tax=Xanthobacter oligotrophicus TaxID=2607286 RepID=A0ABW6ZWR8_9HYPH